ncbi:MAG: PQQ-dependent sugar dehydrogenase, partial [Patescibacteria group bacterium]
TWAPAGAVFWNGSIFFTGLRGESIYETKIAANGKITALVSHFRGAFGRLRAIQIGPDGFLYVSTSNTDGRGEIRDRDDKIIKINPEVFRED